tara:strand:- start:49 stop:645 length:597 start_codon:yes stop_codon:yes gene_type:complete
MIHQIYLNVRGKEFIEHDIFVKSSLAWEDYCYNNNLDYKLWTSDNIGELSLDYKEVFDKLDEEGRDPFVKVDYLRPVILKRYGGCYVDLDIEPKENFKDLYVNNDIIIGSFKNRKGNFEINNNILKLDKEKSSELVEYYKTQIYEKSQVKIYDTWRLRYILQTCGPKSLIRYCKRKNLNFTPDLENYVTDYNTKTWLN